MKTRFLSAIYLSALVITIPLLWLSCASLRKEIRGHHWSAKRYVLVTRVMAKKCAVALGPLVVWVMVGASISAGALYQSWAAALTGAFGGLVFLALVPVVMPTPSNASDDIVALFC